MNFIAVRSIPDGAAAAESKYHHHFDVGCPKCKYTYGFWGPLPVFEEQLRKIGKIGSCSFFPMCARSTKIRFRCQSQRAIEVVDRFPSLEPWKSAQQERKPNGTNPR